MIIERTFCIEIGNRGCSVSMHIEFDKPDEAHAFNCDIVDLYLKHARQHVRPYKYDTADC